MTSPDGINWTIQGTPVNYQWFSVTYGDGLFVAVAGNGSGDQVMTSGATLEPLNVARAGSGFGTVTTNPPAIDCGPATSACERGFVPDSNVTVTATPNPGSVFTGFSGACSGTAPCELTMDGAKSVVAEFEPEFEVEWTSRTSVADNQWSSVAYGNGLFVAVAQSGSGNRVMTSPDGVNWAIRNTPVNNSWISVTFGNGLFVAVSYDGAGNRVMTSPDGVNWTSRSSAADNAW